MFLVRAFSLAPLNKYGLPSTPPFEILDPPLKRAPGFGFTAQWKSVLVTDMC